MPELGSDEGRGANVLCLVSPQPPNLAAPGKPRNGENNMAYPQVGEVGGPYRPRRRRTGLIVAAAVLAVLLLAGIGVWILVGGDDTDPVATPTPSPSSAAPSRSDPPLLTMFKDAELREFARGGAAKATGCEVITQSLSPTSHTTEGLKCTFTGGYRVYYSRYDTVANRDLYTRSARKGFAGGTIVIDGDTFWANDAGAKQGDYVTGYSRKGSSRFIYWDVAGKPISGQVFGTSISATGTEAFWKSITRE